MTTDILRISAVSQWVECEVKALQHPRPTSRTHVAAWVGTMAHAQLALLPRPEEPPRITYDNITTTAYQAEVQASSIAATALRILNDKNIGILDQEMAVRLKDDGVTGHLDLLAWERDSKEEIVIDLKTGQLPGTAWLQVGGYLSARTSAMYGGVLHVPRERIGKDQKGALELRPADELRRAWRQRYNRIVSVIGGAVAMPTPGHHCMRCPIKDCAVRM